MAAVSEVLPGGAQPPPPPIAIKDLVTHVALSCLKELAASLAIAGLFLACVSVSGIEIILLQAIGVQLAVSLFSTRWELLPPITNSKGSNQLLSG